MHTYRNPGYNKFIFMTPNDLTTSPEQLLAYRKAIGIEKNIIARTYIEEAKVLKFMVRKARSPKDVVLCNSVRGGLLTASGLQATAFNQLNASDKVTAIWGRLHDAPGLKTKDFVEELESRYILAKHNTFRTDEQSLATSLAQRKFLRCLISVLSLAGVEYSWKDRKTKKWISGPTGEVNVERLMNALHWRIDDRDRLLLTNLKVPLIDKNVDLVLLDAIPADWQGKDRSLLIQTSRYVALGELKGGVDPAGADEHWKTADTALTRSRTHFQSQRLMPPTFFIGAAIERSMAVEIVGQLEKGILNRAANLTRDDQLVLVCEWLINL